MRRLTCSPIVEIVRFASCGADGIARCRIEVDATYLRTFTSIRNCYFSAQARGRSCDDGGLAVKSTWHSGHKMTRFLPGLRQVSEESVGQCSADPAPRLVIAIPSGGNSSPATFWLESLSLQARPAATGTGFTLSLLATYENSCTNDERFVRL